MIDGAAVRLWARERDGFDNVLLLTARALKVSRQFPVLLNFTFPQTSSLSLHGNRHKTILISLQRLSSRVFAFLKLAPSLLAWLMVRCSHKSTEQTQATDAMLVAMWHTLCKFKFTRLRELHLRRYISLNSCYSVILFSPFQPAFCMLVRSISLDEDGKIPLSRRRTFYG